MMKGMTFIGMDINKTEKWLSLNQTDKLNSWMSDLN